MYSSAPKFDCAARAVAQERGREGIGDNGAGRVVGFVSMVRSGILVKCRLDYGECFFVLSKFNNT